MSVKWRAVIAVAAIVLIVLLAFGIFWFVSNTLPPHIDPNLSVSNIKTKHVWSGGQKILFTLTDNHHTIFSKPLKLRIHILESDDITAHEISEDVQPGDKLYNLPPLADGNNGWKVKVEVEDSDGNKAVAPERSIHIGDDDFIY
jgi:hypothetical protein